MSVRFMFKNFTVHTIYTCHANTILNDFFKSSLTSGPTGRGNEGRNNLQSLLHTACNIRHTASVHRFPYSFLPSSDILQQNQLREQKLDYIFV